jgi:hypothetical protein
VAVALRAAAGATSDELAAALAEVPGRAAFAARRSGADALAELASVPRAWRARVGIWRQGAGTVTAATGALAAFVRDAGGLPRAADRALDAAALATAAVFALQLVLRSRTPARR